MYSLTLFGLLPSIWSRVVIWCIGYLPLKKSEGLYVSFGITLCSLLYRYDESLLPSHPCLRMVSSIEQPLSRGGISRYLITMCKTTPWTKQVRLCKLVLESNYRILLFRNVVHLLKNLLRLCWKIFEKNILLFQNDFCVVIYFLL